MKKFLLVLLFGSTLASAFSAPLYAGETGHYVSGVEGLKAASLPPPGLYNRLYLLYYNADKLMDEKGDELDVGFDLSVFALANRFVWITDKKLLGADYAPGIVVPFVKTDIKIKAFGVDDDQFALGDIFIEPIALAWHGPRHDASFGFGLYAPTGEYDKNKPASAGKDFWTGMFTLGYTRYLDESRTWTAAILSRYEIHREKESTNIKPGNDFEFEWGIAKTVASFWDVGLSGYAHWQVSDDSGSDVTWNKNDHDRVFAVGPEVSYAIPSMQTFFTLRSQWEFDARDRPEGHVTTLIYTKGF